MEVRHDGCEASPVAARARRSHRSDHNSREVAFGSWPKSLQSPMIIVVSTNLDPLVEDGQVNPTDAKSGAGSSRARA